MSKTYRTAQGKSVDMDGLRLSNEDTIAVGNMKVNARGDQLGAGGKVAQKRNQVMDAHYKIQSPAVAENNAYNAQRAQIAQGATPGQGLPPSIDPAGESFEPPIDVIEAAKKSKGRV